jgi:protein CpxP
MLQQLQLTEDQRAQVRTLFEAHRTSVAPLHEELQKNREAIRVASLTTSFSESSVRSLVASAESARTSLIVADAKLMSQIYSVLTPEQRAKLDTIQQERPGKRLR